MYEIINFNFEEAVCSCIHVLACPPLTLRINLFLPIGLAPNFCGAFPEIHSQSGTVRVDRYFFRE